MLKASASSWQPCGLLRVRRNGCLSDVSSRSVAVLRAPPRRVWLHLQPAVGQPSRPQAEETPPPGSRDLGGPLRDSIWHSSPAEAMLSRPLFLGLRAEEMAPLQKG